MAPRFTFNPNGRSFRFNLGDFANTTPAVANPNQGGTFTFDPASAGFPRPEGSPGGPPAAPGGSTAPIGSLPGQVIPAGPSGSGLGLQGDGILTGITPEGYKNNATELGVGEDASMTRQNIIGGVRAGSGGVGPLSAGAGIGAGQGAPLNTSGTVAGAAATGAPRFSLVPGATAGGPSAPTSAVSAVTGASAGITPGQANQGIRAFTQLADPDSFFNTAIKPAFQQLVGGSSTQTMELTPEGSTALASQRAGERADLSNFMPNPTSLPSGEGATSTGVPSTFSPGVGEGAGGYNPGSDLAAAAPSVAGSAAGSVAPGALTAGAEAAIEHGLAAGAVEGLPSVTGELAAGAGAGLAGSATFAGITAIPSLWQAANDYFKNQARVSSVKQTISGSNKEIPQVLGQVQTVAATDPASIASMSGADASKLFQVGMGGYTSSSNLAAPFAHSGAVEAGQRWPDYSQDIQTARTQEPKAFLNTILAYDRAKSQGADTAGVELSFPEALHMIQSMAGLSTYGSSKLTALAPWDPYYAQQPVIPENQETSEGWNPVASGRPASSPAEYLSAIGADPALAAKIQPLIDAAKPGQYLATAQKIFTLLNPQFASTPLGQQLATLAPAAAGGL